MNERILVANMNYLGDALMTTPALSLLHEMSGRPVDVIAGGSAGYAALEILRGNPAIGELIGRALGGAPARCKQFFDVIRKGRYDIVVILPSIPAYLWTARLALAKRIVFVPPAPDGVHMAEHMLQMVAAPLSLQPTSLEMILHVTDTARETARQLLASAARIGPVIGLNLGASRPQKRWPVAAFQETIRRLNRRGYGVVLLGSLSDKVIASRALADFEKDAAVDLTGRTSIPELSAIIEQCAAVVSSDTGAMHMAAALHTPVVALFGSTDPAVTGPIGAVRSQILYKRLHCAPCKSHPNCGGAYTCMASISPLEVVTAVDRLSDPGTGQFRLRIIS